MRGGSLISMWVGLLHDSHAAESALLHCSKKREGLGEDKNAEVGKRGAQTGARRLQFRGGGSGWKDGNPVPTACLRLSEYADGRTLTGLITEYLFSLAEETASVGTLSFLERAAKKAEYESACNDSERVALICPNV